MCLQSLATWTIVSHSGGQTASVYGCGTRSGAERPGPFGALQQPARRLWIWGQPRAQHPLMGGGPGADQLQRLALLRTGLVRRDDPRP
jgi:hypothetical protein